MSDFNPSLPGGTNLSTPSADESVNRENYLVAYLQTVFATYKDKTQYLDKVMKKTLAKGAKSARFYFTGTKNAKFLPRATEAKGGALKFAAKDIELDDIMYSDSFIADVDDHMSVLDTMMENAREDGIALARELDYQISIMITKCSGLNFPVDTPDGTTKPGGTQITLAAVGDEDDAEKLVAAIKAMAQSFDEKNVPDQDRNLFVKPSIFYTLLDSNKLINTDFSAGNDFGQAQLKGAFGFKLFMSNLLVDEDTSTWTVEDETGSTVTKYTGQQAKYSHDCTNVIAQAFDKNSVGVVMARNIKVEKGREYRAQGHFIMTTVFKGIDTLNPVGCGVILKTTV